MTARLGALLMGLALILVCPRPTFGATVADIYKQKCAPCHAATGAGDTKIGKNLRLRDLGSAEVQQQTDDQLTAIITNGKTKTMMPAYGSKLTKEQISELVKLIRSFKK